MVLSQAAGMVAAFGAGKSASLLATTGITAAIAAARLLGGWLIDRLPVPHVAASAQAIALFGAIALTVMPSPEVAILTLGLIGVGYGLISGVTAGAVASYWPKVGIRPHRQPHLHRMVSCRDLAARAGGTPLRPHGRL